jgi:hypothetical protein
MIRRKRPRAVSGRGSTGANGPQAQPGYYPGFSTLSQQTFWDAATRKVILDRVHSVPSIRFFSPAEADLIQAICDRVLPQDDRDETHRIPILPRIDERLYEDRHDGYRFADMPPDREAYRLGLKAIGAIANHLYGRDFTALTPHQQDLIMKSLHDGKPSAADDIWRHLPIHRFWMMLVQDCVEAYYAHPWAWDEIGFGGPAYPRGYMRLENGSPEPWEANEQRYEWEAPATSVSDIYEPARSPIEHPSHPRPNGTK